MFKVIVKFADIMDKNYIYNIGDEYPREGVTVSDERLAELSTEHNRTGAPVIEEIAEEPEIEVEAESEPEVEEVEETEEEKPRRNRSKTK